MTNDLRYALRRLRRAPAFATVAIVTLALGIGVTAGVFSLANWIAFRPVPGVRDQDRVVLIQFRNGDGEHTGISYPNLSDLQNTVGSFAALAGDGLHDPVAVSIEGARPAFLQSAFVSSDYFRALGVSVAAGRPFTREEEVRGHTAPVVVISHRLWVGIFNSDPQVVGRSLRVNRLSATVVGVAAPEFRGTHLLSEFDLWMPASAFKAVLGFEGGSDLSDRGSWMFERLIGRLAPGTSVTRAQAELRGSHAALVASHPEANEGLRDHPPSVHEGIGVPIASREPVRRAVTLLGLVAAVVLLAAGANVANLFLFRAVGRRGEFAVRRALGVSSGRLIRTQLTEFLLVGLAAAAVATLIAAAVSALFRGPVHPSLGDVGPIQLDWQVFVFTGGLALITGLVFGVLPAVLTLRADVGAELKSFTARGSAGARGFRSALAAFQASAGMALLVTSLLLVGTLRNLRRVDVGFDADRVLTFGIDPGGVGYTQEESRAILLEAPERIRQIPGVEEASLSSHFPFTYSLGDRLRGDQAAPSDTSTAFTQAYISPTYFRTMGIRLLAGRPFSQEELFRRLDPNSEGVVVLSATLARRLFGTVNAVDRRVATWLHRDQPWWHRVIGVVEDSRWSTLTDEGAGPMLYQPLPSMVTRQGGAAIFVRSGLPRPEVRAAVEQVVWQLAPSVPLNDMAGLRERIERMLAQERLMARVLTAFSLLAVTLAVVGLYATMAFSVAERARELGIRIAIGARPAQVLAQVVGQGARLGVVGVIVGLLGALALSRLIASRLYGLSPVEPAVYLVAAAGLFGLALLASLVPARAATRVDPVVVLRAE